MKPSIKLLVFMQINVLLLTAAATAQSGPQLWLTDSRLGASLLSIDAVDGDRRVVDFDDYPVVLEINVGVVSPTGAVYLEAVNAAQLSTVVRFDPTSGDVSGISGWVDDRGASERGSGPDFEPGLTGMVIGPWGFLHALRRASGVMSVDVSTGDRQVLSQSIEPAVGVGVELRDPQDLVFDGRREIVLVDRFGGIIRVDPATGSRETGFVFQDLVEATHRIERLPDGRFLHAFGNGDGREITVLDRRLRAAGELSGPSRGDGPLFIGITDLVVAPDGMIYAFDIGLRGILSVEPSTGNRRIVAQDTEGADLGLLSPGAAFIGYALPSALTRPRTSSSRIRPQTRSSASGGGF